jgi:pimeloyl-ACP methyl ester carboxylesterase
MRRRISRLALIGTLTVAACYATFGAAVVLMERRILFPGAGVPLTPRLGPGMQLLQVGALPVLYRPALADHRVVVHFHGNAEQLADLMGLADRFATKGLGFFAPEYPGYGLAPGEPSESSLEDAAEAALQYLEGPLRSPRARIVLEGQSLGTGVAVEMARRGHGARLILLSPYTCVADLGRELLPFYPRRLMVRDAFDSLSKAGAISIPVLVLHGDQDEVVPAAMGRQLAAALPNAQLMLVAGAGHGDLRSLPKVYGRMVAFADE